MTLEHSAVAMETGSEILLEHGPEPQKERGGSGPRPGLRVFVIVAAFVAALGSFSFGYAMSFTSPALLPMQVQKSDSVLGDYHVKDEDGTVAIVDDSAAWFSSLVNIGGLLGSLMAGYSTENFGRRATLIALAVPLTAAWIWTAVTESYGQLVAARIIVGISVGASTLATPMYIVEISPAAYRGFLGTLTQFMVVSGILFVNLLGYAFKTRTRTSVTCPEYHSYGQDVSHCHDIVPGWTCYEPEQVCQGDMANWRTLAFAGAALGLALLVAMPFMPETPVFLATRNPDEARKALHRLRVPGTDLDQELEEIMREQQQGAVGGGQPRRQGLQGALDLLLDNRHALMIGLTLMSFQQLSGINAVIFYATSILEMAGLSDPQLGSIITFIVQFVFTFIAVFLMDRLGRKMLLVLSSSGMFIFAVTMGAFFANDKKPAWLALLSLMGYIAAFSIGMGPVLWVIIGEIFPTEARPLASSLATALNWLTGFVVTQLFSTLTVSLTTQGTFWLFGSLCLSCAVFSTTMVIETKGKSFEQIQREMHKKQ